MLNLDSDSILLQVRSICSRARHCLLLALTIFKKMDELFLLPSSPVAMPRAYWHPQRERQLSSQVMLVKPSTEEFARVQQAIENASPDAYDMEIMNDLYYDSCFVIPHRRYDLLTGEFRSDDNHSQYLGSSEEVWDPRAVLVEAKFLHFSDWPVPKPWIRATPQLIEQESPNCTHQEGFDDTSLTTCADRDLWLAFYEDFAKRRKEVCDMDLRQP